MIVLSTYTVQYYIIFYEMHSFPSDQISGYFYKAIKFASVYNVNFVT